MKRKREKVPLFAAEAAPFGGWLQLCSVRIVEKGGGGGKKKEEETLKMKELMIKRTTLHYYTGGD